MSNYTWIPVFKAVAEFIRDYEGRQSDLIQILKKVGIDTGLDDELADGRRVDLAVMDPFTFFATFMKYGVSKRIELFKSLIDNLGLSVPYPEDFDGVPSAQPLKVWLFPYQKSRTPDMVDNLWKLFHVVMEDSIDGLLFDKILKIPHTGFAKLTECLFYVAPGKYFPVDAKTKPWLIENEADVPTGSWVEYKKLLDWLEDNATKPYYEISHKAADSSQHLQFSAVLADEYLSDRFAGTRSSTSHILAYKTEFKRELAFDPGGNPAGKRNIKIFVDAPPPASMSFESEAYLAEKTRNHHLSTHAPTLSHGHTAWTVKVSSLDQLKTLCDWYEPQEKEGVIMDEKLASNISNFKLNQILYGPPGTGKTYATAELAVKIAEPEFYEQVVLTTNENERRKVIKARYDDLVESNRVGFATFHQSFCYEDFIEGIRAKTSDDGGGLVYEVEDGIFKKLAALAGSHSSEIVVDHSLSLEGRRIWKMSLGNTLQESDDGYQNCLELGYVGLGYGGDIDFYGSNSREEVSAKFTAKTGEDYDHNTYKVTAVNTFKNEIKNGDLVVVSDGNHKFRAIAEVTGDYEFSVDDDHHFYQRRNVVWLQQFEPSLPKEALFKKSLSQRTLYELKPKTIMMDRLQEYLSVPADTTPGDRNYVLILDEINRGNIARIFGELITLLEPDKRKNGEDERSVILPYSKELFTVPENLYVIGTMNTADKSLAQLDLALRRRFDFVEVMPKPGLLNGVEAYGVSVENLLEVINARIEVLLDRDHLIGHSYFLPLKQVGVDKDHLISLIFENRIIPLLQEYFFSDWEKIGWVLNDIDKPWDERFIQLQQDNVALNSLFSAKVADEVQDRRYKINTSAFTNPAAYRGILLGNVSE
jgi:5-methylcytosine-specific restriction protein B